MRRKLNTVLIGATLVVLITGCTSPQADTPAVPISSAPKLNVAIVHQTLQKYQVGKTTFADFKRDAGLVMMQRPSNPFPKRSSSSQQPAISPILQSTNPDQARYEPVSYYAVPAGSPWMLCRVQDSIKYNHGSKTETHSYFVGDTNHVISILEFDQQGNLTSILP